MSPGPLTKPPLYQVKGEEDVAERAHISSSTTLEQAPFPMTLLFEPDGSQETTIKVIAAKTVEERTTPIKQP
jgi:hypothetical protein